MGKSFLKNFFSGRPKKIASLDSHLLKKANEELYKRSAELSFRNKTLSLLDTLYAVATQAIEINDVARELTGQIVKILGVPYAAIILYHEAENSFELVGYSDKRKFLAGKAIGTHVADPSYIGFSILRERKSLYLLSVGQVVGPFFSDFNIKKYLNDLGVASTLVYPLHTERGAIGILVVGINREEKQLNAFEREGIASAVNVVAVAIDKTSAYAELKKANLILREIDRQKTDFMSIASHQLRTPLTIFKGYFELLQDGAYGKLTKDTKKLLTDLDINNEHLIKLVDEFLNASRIEQGRTNWEFSKNDLGVLIDEVAGELATKAQANDAKILWRAPVAPAVAILDKEKIYHVIYNFVDNAIKYGREGEVKISLVKEDGGYVVRVKDNGIGFDAEDGGNFFQKFYRGKNVRTTSHVTGNGLGLFICGKFVEGHHGRFWATSDGLGLGSEFGFWIPFDGQKSAV